MGNKQAGAIVIGVIVASFVVAFIAMEPRDYKHTWEVEVTYQSGMRDTLRIIEARKTESHNLRMEAEGILGNGAMCLNSESNPIVCNISSYRILKHQKFKTE